MPQFALTFNGALPPLLRGFTISFLMLMGATPAIFAGQLADRFGHLRIVLLGGVVFGIGAVMQAAAMKLGVLLAGRALAGVGEGLWLTNMAMYVSLLSPPLLV